MAVMKKTTHYSIQPRDVDYHDILKPTAIIDFFQDIAGVHATELGIGYEKLIKENNTWIVLYQQFEMVAIPKYHANIEIVTWPKSKGRLEFERELLILDEDGNTLVKGISNWLVLNLKTHAIVRASEIDLNGEYETFTNYPNKCKRKLELDQSLIEDTFTYEVCFDDLDHNGHMNNAKYVNIIFNHYPFYGTNKYTKSVEIAYIKEAKFHETITIGHYKNNSKDAYIGFLDKELCFECVIEVAEK